MASSVPRVCLSSSSGFSALAEGKGSKLHHARAVQASVLILLTNTGLGSWPAPESDREGITKGMHTGRGASLVPKTDGDLCVSLELPAILGLDYSWDKHHFF